MGRWNWHESTKDRTIPKEGVVRTVSRRLSRKIVIAKTLGAVVEADPRAEYHRRVLECLSTWRLRCSPTLGLWTLRLYPVGGSNSRAHARAEKFCISTYETYLLL